MRHVVVSVSRHGIVARFALLASFALAGCSDTVSLLPGVPGLPVPDAVRVVKDVDQPRNSVERVLSDCGRGRTPAGETGCLKEALTTGGLNVPDLIRVIPGCRAETVCRYQYTTVDRVGFVPVTETKFSVRWQVEFDLRKPVKSAGDVPVTVTSL